ncbi:hypothetical protein AKJ16_DCAP13863 [Drosera capensis]
MISNGSVSSLPVDERYELIGMPLAVRKTALNHLTDMELFFPSFCSEVRTQIAAGIQEYVFTTRDMYNSELSCEIVSANSEREASAAFCSLNSYRRIRFRLAELCEVSSFLFNVSTEEDRYANMSAQSIQRCRIQLDRSSAVKGVYERLPMEDSKGETELFTILKFFDLSVQ